MAWRSRVGRAVAVALVVLGLLAVRPAAAEPGLDETLLLTLTNATRLLAGAPPLVLDSALSGIAETWAATMAATGVMAHNPDLKSQVGPRIKAGENVGYGGTVEAINAMLLNSPGHYRNIVDPDFQKVGLGVVRDSGTVWLVQVFLLPADSRPAVTAAPAAPAPAPVPEVTSPPTTARVRATTTAAAPTTTTTVPVTTTTTTTLPPASPGLPLQVTLLVQHLRTLGIQG